MSWNHTSGCNVHLGGRISGTNMRAIENVARYMSRPAISTDRVKYTHKEGYVTVYEKRAEFLAFLASHILAPYETGIFYCGVSCFSYRGKENRIQKQKFEAVPINGKAGTIEGRMTSTWAQLIKNFLNRPPEA